jgi:hypothetical protein
MSAAQLALKDPIFGRIARAVPRGVDPMLRDDIMSDVYLAIREGRVHPREIEQVAKQFISAAFAAFSNRWGAISLDATIGDGSTATFLDALEDERALAAFDRVRLSSEEIMH